MAGLLGRKMGMTQVFDEAGNVVPVTVVEAGPCTVVQIKTPEKDGYAAVQLGFLEQKPQRVSKPLRGHFARAKVKPMRYLREFPLLDDGQEVTLGQVVRVENIFEAGEFVDVSGMTKGKGFAGGRRRYGFAGNPASHGTHETFRGPGSIGTAGSPSKVLKGHRMAGRMGNEKRTVQNLRIVQVIPERNLLLIKGALPGRRGGIVTIKKSVKKSLGF
ncbi:MAG: 50S ribosomal protein L3 [Nitrospinota bacterium]|nr:MAG: 50S ribosomal protein L3 [Nitrospinota bacterium]